MRAFRQIVWPALLGVALVAPLRAEDGFPYKAYVALDGAEVVSGPGHRYYATDHLALGTKVEVYREEASGWLAIRPPQGSFSWVDAAAIERDEEDESLGRVIEPTPAWIGTAAERVREHRQRVTLKADEVVRILGEKQVETEEGEEETWLKIAPPAGEFRWIFLRDVSRQRPEPRAEPLIDEQLASEPAEQPAPEEPRRIEVPRSAIALRDLAPVVSRINEPGRNVEAAQFRSSVEPAKPLSSDGFVPRKRRGSEQLQTVPVPSEHLAGRQAATFTRPRVDPPALVDSAGPSKFTSVAAASTPAAAAPIDNAASQLQQLDVELSLMLAKDKSAWDLTDLRQRVEVLVERGNDPVARGQARLLLDKITQFEQTFDAEDIGPVAASAAVPAVEADAKPSPGDPRYDSKGWLKPVVSRRSEKPPAPFAIVDADGKPICFVSPSPGLNLNRYVNKQVGVYGRRGYIESLKTTHVTAERVIDLSRHVR
jgi:hypothetical protein